MLKPRKMGQWTNKELIAVWKSKRYESDNMWSSPLVEGWFEVEPLSFELAEFCMEIMDGITSWLLPVDIIVELDTLFTKKRGRE